MKLRQEWLDPEYKHINSRSSLNKQQPQDFYAKWHRVLQKIDLYGKHESEQETF